MPLLPSTGSSVYKTVITEIDSYMARSPAFCIEEYQITGFLAACRRRERRICTGRVALLGRPGDSRGIDHINQPGTVESTQPVPSVEIGSAGKGQSFQDSGKFELVILRKQLQPAESSMQVSTMRQKRAIFMRSEVYRIICTVSAEIYRNKEFSDAMQPTTREAPHRNPAAGPVPPCRSVPASSVVYRAVPPPGQRSLYSRRKP